MSTRLHSLLAAGLVAAAVTLPLALVVAPPDAVQGNAQRLMYLHVPAAWTAFLCFAVVVAACAWQLVRGSQAAQRVARAAAEVGVGLTALTLLTGSVWGALSWGTWWAWDARIMSTVAMGLVYVAYLTLGGLARGSRGHRLAAVVGIGGFLTVPLVHFSVLWWRTLHQPPTILAPSLDPPIDRMMLVALAAAVVTFTLLAAWAVARRVSVLGAGAAPAARAAAIREPVGR